MSISSGVSIDLSDEEKAAASAAALQSDMRDPEIKAKALWDTDKERWHIRISHHIYGNTHHSYLEPEFLRSRDYAVLTECSEALKGVIGEGAVSCAARKHSR